MQYLGTTPKSSSYDIATVNLNSHVNNIKVDIERWESLPLSIQGRIDPLKMKDHFPYVGLCSIKSTIWCEMRTKYLEKSFFKETEVTFRNFTWNNKTPRVSLKKLHVDRKKGGLGLPKCAIIISPSRNSRFPLKLGYG